MIQNRTHLHLYLLQAVLKVVNSLEAMQEAFNEGVAWTAAATSFPMLGLRMPVTPEEDDWLDAHLAWFDKAFWSVRADEEVASLLYDRSDSHPAQLRWSEACVALLAARMRRVAQAQPELSRWPTPEHAAAWDRLWSRNGARMVSLCAARLDACRTGEEQHRFLIDPNFESGGCVDLCYRRISDWSNCVEVFRDDRAFRLLVVVLLLDSGSDEVRNAAKINPVRTRLSKHEGSRSCLRRSSSAVISPLHSIFRRQTRAPRGNGTLSWPRGDSTSLSTASARSSRGSADSPSPRSRTAAARAAGTRPRNVTSLRTLTVNRLNQHQL